MERADAHMHLFAPGYVDLLPEACRRVAPDEVTLRGHARCNTLAEKTRRYVGPRPGANRPSDQGCRAEERGIELPALDPAIARLQCLGHFLQANERLASLAGAPHGHE